jgi:hypothetical protein
MDFDRDGGNHRIGCGDEGVVAGMVEIRLELTGRRKKMVR